MASSTLKISQEAMETARSNYSDCVSRMTTLRNNLQTAVDNIKSDWQTEAGKVFFQKFNDEWYKNFNDYIDVIDHMSDNMQKSKNKYQVIFDEADKLGIK